MINIEGAIVEFLNGHPDITVEAFMGVPPNRPSSFITVERVGGGRDTFRDLPLIVVQCWAPSRWVASEMSWGVADVLEHLVELPEVAKVTIESVVNFPDPDWPKIGRYQITIGLVTKG